MSTKVTLPTNLSTIRTIGPAVGAGGLIVGAVLAFLFGGLHYFFEAYLFSFWVLLGLSLGSLALIMIHHMTAGAWSFVTQRILEAFTRTLPVLAIGFLPILVGPLLGWNDLFDAWVHPGSHVVENKLPYLNPGFWSLRAVLFFAIWGGIAYAFNRWSRQLENTGDALITLKFRFWAPLGLIAYCLTMTFAAADWGQSIEPEWFSTIYAPLTWMSQAITTFAVTILILSSLADEKPLSRFITVEHYHTLGNLMCGFIVLWAYMSFAQYLIIWAGNLPEEIQYYLDRRGSGYFHVIIALLMLGHFFFPFLILLQRKITYSISRLRKVCYWMLAMRLADVFFVINPGFHGADSSFPFKDIVVHVFVLAGFAGIYFWYFLGELTKMDLLPLNDPRLYDAVDHVEREEALEHA